MKGKKSSKLEENVFYFGKFFFFSVTQETFVRHFVVESKPWGELGHHHRPRHR